MSTVHTLPTDNHCLFSTVYCLLYFYSVYSLPTDDYVGVLSLGVLNVGVVDLPRAVLGHSGHQARVAVEREPVHAARMAWKIGKRI